MRKSQSGFTLVELLMAMLVSGFLLNGIVIAIFQTFGVAKTSRTEITALENIKNAAYQITRDVKKASASNLIDGGPVVNSLNLSWTIWYDANGNLIPSGEAHSSAYSLSGTNLQRNYDGNITTVGRYISSLQFSLQTNIITVSITASPEGKPETARTRTYCLNLQSKEAAVR